MEIFDCSPRAASKITSYNDPIGTLINVHHRSVYPFDELKIGKCFTLPIVGSNEMSLRVSTSAAAKRTGKKFTVIKHQDHGIIEVARIA